MFPANMTLAFCGIDVLLAHSHELLAETAFSGIEIATIRPPDMLPTTTDQAQ